MFASFFGLFLTPLFDVVIRRCVQGREAGAAQPHTPALVPALSKHWPRRAS